jgi:hypothetical protein
VELFSGKPVEKSRERRQNNTALFFEMLPKKEHPAR